MSSRIHSEFGTLGERFAAMKPPPVERPVDPARHVRAQMASGRQAGLLVAWVPAADGKWWGKVAISGAPSEASLQLIESMTETKAGGQSIRRAARQAAIAAQAKRRAQAAERDKRVDAAALTLIVALHERDALERQAGAAIRPMLTEGLSLADVVTWTDCETTHKEDTRLVDLATEAGRR